ncbi:MAG: thiamine pyrophosphate-binding protein [Parafilimonas sp.]
MRTNTYNLTVDDLIVHFLKLEGVKYIFGVPGGGLINILNTLKNNVNGLTYFICRHETGAAYIADGYYRATGNLGVVMVTTGPALPMRLPV